MMSGWGLWLLGKVGDGCTHQGRLNDVRTSLLITILRQIRYQEGIAFVHTVDSEHTRLIYLHK